MSTAVTVAVRCRPLSGKELREGSKSIISMEDTLTSIADPANRSKSMSFNFDFSFWSGCADDANFVGQSTVFDQMGTQILDHCFSGFNACLFAYGQTGSGKTYSMMGYGEDRGIIPRLCNLLFDRATEKKEAGGWDFQAQVSYLEIYNEKCRCLLSPNGGKGKEFRVREHPVTGPYVENLAKVVVHSFDEIEKLMEDGNKSRTVASTAMNATSSRSHAIFCIQFTQKRSHQGSSDIAEMVSRINLVDLAGSERADRTGATGDILKEGSNINRSLTTLGKVISALAESGDGKKQHVPFRDSALTWLLKDNLSGNSKTCMLAALSPADSNYDETISTLRYADRAKRLRTRAIVNEDPKSKKIRELSDEIERLRLQLQNKASGSPSLRGDSAGLESPRSGSLDYESLTPAERIEIVQTLLQQETASWADNEAETMRIQAERAQAFTREGVGVAISKHLPSLVNLNEDPALCECLVYCLNVGSTVVGAGDDEGTCGHSIVLAGPTISAQHATFVVTEEHGHDVISGCADSSAGSDSRSPSPRRGHRRVVTILTPVADAPVCVNGSVITGPLTLSHGARIIFGDCHVFRFSDPTSSSVRLTGSASPRHGTALAAGRAVSEYQKAIEERFESERAAWMKDLKERNESVGSTGSFGAPTNPDADRMAVKITELQKKIEDMEANQKSQLNRLFLAQNSVETKRHTDPTAPPLGSTRPAVDGAATKQSALSSVASFSVASKVHRLPPQQVFREKIVLLGHQEVGKTSLRKCFLSDPLFFKSLPEVQATTGIEAHEKSVLVDATKESVDLTIQDFAGQEAYHSHTLFLSGRTVFLLVWKISAVEHGYDSRSIDEAEEQRMCKWVAEVYAKYPTAPIALVATHLDELRNSSQPVVEAILNKVASMVQNYIRRIARVDGPHACGTDGSPAQPALPLIGSFAVSCKQRIVTGAGPHSALAGQKVSALLKVFATAALRHCKADPVFWGGAVPGRHLMLIQEVKAMAASKDKLLLALSEFVHVAARLGIENDKELLEVTQLMHTWNIVFMFNQQDITDNAFLFLHPMWLCHIAGVLFSVAHFISTPIHLRSIIGGLDYLPSAAELADGGLMGSGILRFNLARLIFTKALSAQLQRQPEDQDFEMVLKVLHALELVVPFQYPCDDPELLQQETPAPQSIRGRRWVTRYFVPSLSPFCIPPALRRVATLLCNRGVHVAFRFNLLPDELWWRLLHRLHRHRVSITVASPHRQPGEFDDALRESGEIHCLWRDAAWLGNERSRVLMVRDNDDIVRLFSCEVGHQPLFNSAADAGVAAGGPTGGDVAEKVAVESDGSDVLLKNIESETAALLREYPGIRRWLMVGCPVQECHAGFLDIDSLPEEGNVECPACLSTYDVQNIVISGTSPLGPKLFPDHLHAELREGLEQSVDHRLVHLISDFLGIRGGRTGLHRDVVAGDELSVESGNFAADFMAGLDRVVRRAALQFDVEEHERRLREGEIESEDWN